MVGNDVCVERRMSESRVRENLMHGLMRGKRAEAL